MQQIGILIGALTSAVVIGATVKFVNDAGTHYTRSPDYLPSYVVPAEELSKLEVKQRVGRPYRDQDPTLYHVLYATEGQIPGVAQGKYLVDDQGRIQYLEDPAINGRLKYDDIEAEKKARKDRGEDVVATPVPRYEAPKTKLMALIIDGILQQKLPWSLVLIGALLSISLELCAVPSLPFAVGIYLPLQTSFPIFLGGVARWIVEKVNPPKPEESESSPGVLLCSGYIAGGAIVGVLAAFLYFNDKWVEWLNLAPALDRMFGEGLSSARWTTMLAFAVMVILLLAVGMAGRFSGKKPPEKAPAGQQKKA
jgi:hypothetical protein